MYQYWHTRDDKPAPHLKTGGTSVVHVILENRWRTAYLKEKGTEVDFESTGSTKGVEGVIEKKYAIGFTHAPLSSEEKKRAEEKGGEVVQVPVVLCAVVPIYNVKELKEWKEPLNFNAEVLARIYLGDIKMWDDEAIKKLNQNAPLPKRPIKVVHRSDSSGTTQLFTDYLQASKAWRDAGRGPAASKIDWHGVGEGKDRNLGVAIHVSQTEDAIGYVDLVWAVNDDYNLQYGAVRNKADTKFIQVKAKNMTAAAEEALKGLSDDLSGFSLTNRDGDDSYPISGAIWAVCYRNQSADHKQVTEFLHWITHQGQEFAENMAYAPLPKGLVERVDGKIQSIKAQ
jgi:phosphate transport system substrate-binding protein